VLLSACIGITSIPTPTVVRVWEAGEAGLYPLVIEAGLGTQRMVWRDMQYREASRESIEEFIKWDITDRLRRTSLFDCDDFTLLFDANIHKWCAGIAVGQIGYLRADGKKHALNIIFMDGKFWLFEPQTDRLWEASFEVLDGMVLWFLF